MQLKRNKFKGEKFIDRVKRVIDKPSEIFFWNQSFIILSN